MNKAQILILLLIIVLVFYYLSSENKPSKSNDLNEPWIIVEPKKPNTPSSIHWTNPPHSHLDKTPITKVEWPSNQTSSELTPEEKLQRQLQEQQDYQWLLNNKTLADWHHERKLTDAQYQTLLPLIDSEEMNTWEYFLNFLPVNYEWKALSLDFTPPLIEKWINQGFNLNQTKEWLLIGLQPTEAKLAHFLKTVKNLTPEEVLNFSDLEELKSEFNHYAN